MDELTIAEFHLLVDGIDYEIKQAERDAKQAERANRGA